MTVRRKVLPIVVSVVVFSFSTQFLWCRQNSKIAPDLEKVVFRGKVYWIRKVDLADQDLRLYFRRKDGTLIGSFRELRKEVEGTGKTLRFATNAGMFSPPPKRPVGLYVENGRTMVPVNHQDGEGNFFLKPNGVFFVAEGRAGILEAGAFARLDPGNVRIATQSGPMLVIKNRIHPAFRANSRNENIRSGVGIGPDGNVVFALSREPVNFHDFAMLFREELSCRDAIYLDGVISRMYFPGSEAQSGDEKFGPIFAIVE